MALLPATKILSKYGSSSVTATLTLARWQWLRIWRPLFFIGLGMLVAMILTCTLPLFSWLALSAGLHTALQLPDNAYVSAHSTPPLSIQFNPYTSPLLPTGNSVVASDVHKYLGGLASTTPIQEVHSDSIVFTTPRPAPALPARGMVQVLGVEIPTISSHVHMLSGRLPDTRNSPLEIAISRATALYMDVQVGALFNTELHYKASILRQGATDQTEDVEVLPLHVVGIFQPADDLFWHGQAPGITYNQGTPSQRVIMPAETWLNTLSTVSNPAETLESFDFSTQLFWYYRINQDAVTSKNFAAFLDALNAFSFNTSVDMQVAGMTEPTVSIPTATLQQYSDHITVAQLPTEILTLLVIALLVLFISLMSELLIERQAAAVAILRSRGASHTQIFISVFAQWVGLAVVSLLIGPWLAIPVTTLLVQHTLATSDQPILLLLTHSPFAALFDLRWLILGTMLVVLLAMGLATFRATRFDVLALRRESSRESRPPFWQRAYLDLLALFCAVVGYAVAMYVVNANLLDDKVRVVLQAPLILVTSTLLLLAGALIFLRLFPYLLRLCLFLFARGRGVTSLLSLGLMSRAPRQALRMVLLLTFALAFTIFALLFSTSQQQHLLDVAAYQTGADFSGEVTPFQGETLTQQIAPYQHIAGVHAVTMGYTAPLRSATGNTPTGDMPLKMLAIDPATFAAATSWANLPSDSRDLLLQQLTRQRTTLQQRFTAGARDAQSTLLPLIIDTQASQVLHLQVGSQIHFFQTIGGNATQDGVAINPNCVVIGEVPTIPSINDNAGIGNGEAGVLLDYQSYSTLVQIQGRQAGLTQPANYLWLNTADDAHTLAHVRTTLTQGPLALSQLNDRRAILTTLKVDPLYLNFVGVLILGAIAPILLALVGNLLSSWWSARNRVSSFVVLRALGSSSAQLNLILFCEQALIYLTALLLGLLFGFLLATLTLPSLVFTSITQSGIINEGNIVDTFSLQHIPPVQLIVPPALFLVLSGLLLICIVALAIMVRTVTRPALAQTLRVNED